MDPYLHKFLFCLSDGDVRKVVQNLYVAGFFCFANPMLSISVCYLLWIRRMYLGLLFTSSQSSVLLFLTHNLSLLFSGLPLETLRLKVGKIMDAGEHRHCKGIFLEVPVMFMFLYWRMSQSSHVGWERVLGCHVPFAACILFCFLMLLCTCTYWASTIGI